MAKQIYKSGNYVIVDNTPGDYQFSTRYSYFIEEYNKFIIIDKVNRVTIHISDAANYTDDSATAYTESTLRDFLITNTSSLSSSGSGGGGGSTPVGATLMKTNQTVSYRTGDDGDIEAGRATDFFTLASANPFNTLERFTDELGTQTYTNNIVIDWSTYNGTDVLGYLRLFQQGIWNDAIDNSLAYSVGTYTSGWRLSNIKEIMNIANYGTANTLFYSPFNFSSALIYSSTGAPNNANNVIMFRNQDGEIQDFTKTLVWPYIPVRNFTVSGTTLT